MSFRKLGEHNVIAAYPDQGSARSAVESLFENEVDARQISYLAERSEGDLEPPEGGSIGTATEEVPGEVGKRTMVGAAGGGAAGGAAGFLAGLAAIGIPGAGPLIGAGVWAATAGGVAAGATAGGVAAGIDRMWELHYRDAVAAGSALVGVHSDDATEVEKAAQLLADKAPMRVDRLDSEGNMIEGSA